MGAPLILCSFCQFRPVQAGSSFCCEACGTLAGLEEHPDQKNLLKPEDFDLAKNFGLMEGNLISFECQVEPLACEACLMGLARVPQMLPGLFDFQWNRDQSILKFQFAKGTEFPSHVFQFLQKLGLQPRWQKAGDSLADGKFHRTRVMRLALTAALAGNMMLFSIPIYAGLAGSLQTAFEWIQFFLFLPVVFFSARPFFQSAWVSLRLRQLNVDLPLTVAFLAGSGFSALSLFSGKHEIYFDSLAGFIFLILWSRFLMENSLAKHLKTPTLDHFFEKPLFAIQRKDQSHLLPWKHLEVGDLLTLSIGDRLPADGVLVTSSAEFESAWMNGESKPFLRLQGSEIQAGLKLVSNAATIRITQTPEQTDFARIIENLKAAPEKIRESAEAKIGSVLVLGCFCAIFLLFLFGAHLGLSEIIRRSIALLIVACPCAISFAAPLARARGGQIALRNGFWIRDPQIWKNLAAPKKIAFDKTGTLTTGKLSLATNSPLLDQRWKQIILSLENISRHPVAEALRKTWGTLPLLEVSGAKEIPGRGVEGTIQGAFYEVRGFPSPDGHLKVALYQNGNPMTELEFQDSGRAGISKSLGNLRKKYHLYLISGDTNERVHSFAHNFGFEPHRVWGGLLPHEKKAKLEEVQPDIYVGDGTNDLLAMKRAPVSVAMHGASLEAQAASDVLMLQPDVGHFETLFSLAREVGTLIRRNLALALFYNLAAGSAALLGYIQPLEAAILMPVASLVLLFSTLAGTKRLHQIGSKK